MGYKMTDEHKERISKNNACYWAGKPRSEKTKLKLSRSHTGKKLSEETKQKISESLKDQWASGKRRSKESKQKRSEGMKTAYRKNPELAKNKTFWKGKILSLDHRRKMSESHKEYFLKEENRIKQSLARGGDGILNKEFIYHWEFRHNKPLVHERDSYQCQDCGIYLPDEFASMRDCHHLDRDKSNNSLDNLITLCKSCHGQTHINKVDEVEKL